MESHEEKLRARAERDALIRAWRRKSDAIYRRAREPRGFRRIVHVLRTYPGSLAADIVAVIAMFGLTYVALLFTGAH